MSLGKPIFDFREAAIMIGIDRYIYQARREACGLRHRVLVLT
jgi:hypothetical protein